MRRLPRASLSSRQLMQRMRQPLPQMHPGEIKQPSKKELAYMRLLAAGLLTCSHRGREGLCAVWTRQMTREGNGKKFTPPAGSVNDSNIRWLRWKGFGRSKHTTIHLPLCHPVLLTSSKQSILTWTVSLLSLGPSMIASKSIAAIHRLLCHPASSLVREAMEVNADSFNVGAGTNRCDRNWNPSGSVRAILFHCLYHSDSFLFGHRSLRFQ